MKLHIKNIAKIKEAEIAVDGITVIAGVNNTGKSTVGKVLFALFQVLQNKNKHIFDAKVDYAKNHISMLFALYAKRITDPSYPSFHKEAERKQRILAETIVTKNQNMHNRITEREVNACIQEFLQDNPQIAKCIEYSEDYKNRNIKHICEYLNVSDNDVLTELTRRKFYTLFNGQVNSLDAIRQVATVKLVVKEKPTIVKFKNHLCYEVDSTTNLTNKAVYIDNPLIFEKLSALSDYEFEKKMRFMPPSVSAGEDILNLLEHSEEDGALAKAIDNILKNRRLEKVLKLLNEAIDARIINTEAGYELVEKGAKYGVRFANLSLGLRTFILLKMFIEKDLINDKDVIILDEPEIHLHPQWQVLFAHLIVLLQREFNLSVVLTTHSHFFVDAINLYSKKYKTDDNVHFYLSGLEGKRAVISEVTPDNLDDIYQMMAVAVEELESLRYELEQD